MRTFTTKSPKLEVIAHLQGVTARIMASMEAALPESLRLHHDHGWTLEPGKPYDRQYFAYTMRKLAKRNLAEFGVESEIENEMPEFQIQAVSLGGLVLRKPGFLIRILRPDSNLELPRAASESRALFYEQRQTAFDFAEDITSDDELHIVYLWDIDPEFKKFSWHIVCPKNRKGECYWKVSLGETAEKSNRAVDDDSTPPSRPPIAAVASIADSDLEFTRKGEEERENETVKIKGASNGA